MTRPVVATFTRHDRTWLAAFAVVMVTHLVWLLLDQAPPIWDMAVHQLQGWNYLRAWKDGLLWEDFARISTSYPPLYYLQEAFWLGLLGDTRLLAFWANLPGIFLTGFATYRMGLRLLRPGAAVGAGILVLLLPMVAWTSRESLLDGPLMGWTALGAFLILKSNSFLHIGWTLAFGAVCGAGVLTKWTLPLYLVFPVCYGLWRSRRLSASLTNLAGAGLLAALLALPFYGPHLGELASRYPTTDQAGLIPWKPFPRHGEPGLNNLWGWIYYPRVLASYFLQLPLTLFFAAGLLRSWSRSDAKSADAEDRVVGSLDNRGFLWIWLLGGLFIATFLSPKDPRFALPLAPPQALLLASFWQSRPRVLKGLMACAAVQYLFVSFWIFEPVRLAVNQLPDDRDFQSLQREWVFLESDYQGVLGPPRHETWPYRQIVDRLPPGASVAFLPQLPRFHPVGLRLAAVRRDRRLNAYPLGEIPNWRAVFEQSEFLVTKSGQQGISFITIYNVEIQAAASNWPELGSWPAPDGSTVRLLGRE